jgi:hypothetical protein
MSHFGSAFGLPERPCRALQRSSGPTVAPLHHDETGFPAAGKLAAASTATPPRARAAGDLNGLSIGRQRLAERVGFEPTIRGKPYDDLANRCLQPLGHLSGELDMPAALILGKQGVLPRIPARKSVSVRKSVMARKSLCKQIACQ